MPGIGYAPGGSARATPRGRQGRARDQRTAAGSRARRPSRAARGRSRGRQDLDQQRSLRM